MWEFVRLFSPMDRKRFRKLAEGASHPLINHLIKVILRPNYIDTVGWLVEIRAVLLPVLSKDVIVNKKPLSYLKEDYTLRDGSWNRAAIEGDIFVVANYRPKNQVVNNSFDEVVRFLDSFLNSIDSEEIYCGTLLRDLINKWYLTIPGSNKSKLKQII